MEAFKGVLKRRMVILGGLLLVGVVVQLCEVFNVVGVAENSFAGDVVSGFQSGLLSSFMIICAYLIYRYGWVLKDHTETRLKMLYNSEHDERKKQIREKSGAPVILFSAGVIILAAIIAGYFNEIVFFTLIGCAMFELTLCVVLKAYYFKKY